jgi:hypothetical protein
VIAVAPEARTETTAPGLAPIETCPDCISGVDPDGDPCVSCNGAGRQIWRACPRCGDIAFEYNNGHDETAGMRCGLGCGYHWTADDPGWLAQHAI